MDGSACCVELGFIWLLTSDELVLLIEFSNGSTQVFNSPKRNVYKPNNLYPDRKTKMNEVLFRNEFYMNTLSLYNADLSLYYE